MRGFVPLLSALLVSCGQQPVELIVSCPSPSGAQVASLMRLSAQEVALNIRPADMALDAGMRSFVIRHGYDGVLSWLDERHLRVDYPKDAIVLMRENVLLGTTQTFDAGHPLFIGYRPVPSVHGRFMTDRRCFR